MNFFRKKHTDDSFAVQSVSGESYSFNSFERNRPITRYEKQLYRELRENIPIIDAAIYKIIRLVGRFTVKCDDISVQNKLNLFLGNVRVNGCEKGIDSFISCYLNQLLTYGTAIGEIIPDSFGADIAALYNSSLDDVELIADDNPFNVKIYSISSTGARREVKYPDLILCNSIAAEAGSIYGTSILRGLPFVSNILKTILKAIGTNWERVGNVRFAITYKPDENDRSFSKERASQIAEQWKIAMKSREPKDFVSVGDVSIKVIGADNQIPDCEVPIRQILEQIVSKLSIPPFMLGLSWSTTEKMSSQQADILTSELEYYRTVLNGAIMKICSLYMQLHGISRHLTVEWDNINLQDEVELANARLYNAQAEEIEIRNAKEKKE